VTGELKCSWKESSAAQSTSTGGSVGNYKESFNTTGLRSGFLVLPIIFVVIWTNITPTLPASIMNILFSIVRYLDTECVHSPTCSFNSLRAYTLSADAYELPVSCGQSIGPNVTLGRVASRGLWSRLPSQSLSRPQPPHISTLSRSTGCLTTIITLTPWHNVFLISCEFLNSFRISVS
jgi:hypothetical protein